MNSSRTLICINCSCCNCNFAKIINGIQLILAEFESAITALRLIDVSFWFYVFWRKNHFWCEIIGTPPFLFQSQIIYLNNNVTEINIICQNYFDLHVTADLEPKLEDKWVLNRLSQLFTMVGFFLAIAILHLFIAEKWAETSPPFPNSHFRKYFFFWPC